MSPAVESESDGSLPDESELTPIPLASIEAIVFNVIVDPPNIVYWLSGGETYVNATVGMTQFNELCAGVQEALGNEDFVQYHNLFFRAERLQTCERRYSQELGDYLSFFFQGEHEYREQYTNRALLENDLQKITDILSVLQDIRASKHASSVKH